MDDFSVSGIHKYVETPDVTKQNIIQRKANNSCLLHAAIQIQKLLYLRDRY